MKNIVIVPNKNAKRFYIDLRELDKASHKVDHPLLNIDILVDNTVGHALFLFMDEYTGYNKVKISVKDQLKAFFTIP